MGDAKAINTKSESLRKFSGESLDFKKWSEKMMDHLAKVHPMWKPTLEWMGSTHEDLSFQRLRREVIGPYQESAVDLAVKLEQLICDWVPDRLYNRRVQLAGGPNEKQNGFIMWRTLHKEYVGEGETTVYAGSECVREYPRCNKLSELHSHIDGWYELCEL